MIYIVANIFWFGYIIPEENSFTINYERYVEYVGTDKIVTSYGGELGEEFLLKEFSTEKVVNINGNILEIKSVIIGNNPLTGEVIFHDEDTYFIDRVTKTHAENPKSYYAFPTNVEQRDYEFYHPFIASPATFSFSETEMIDDLKTYVFICSVTSDHSNAFPQFPSRTILVDYLCKFWIEPKTGSVVKFQSSWDNYFVENGKRVYPVEVGGKHSSDYVNRVAIQLIDKKIERLMIYENILPVIIIVIAVSSIMVEIMFTQFVTKKSRRDAEKFETIGLLAANITHDIRNPLAIIQNAIELIQKNPDSEILNNESEKINRGVKRIAHQVNQVLNYLKKTPLVTKNTTALTVLKQSLDDISIPDNISIEIPKKDSDVKWDETKILAVFTNLILNAIEAIGKEEGKISVRIFEESEFIIIEIENSGPDIPEKDLGKIFDPLYTTKKEGTGLGLAGCKNIIQSHKGSITVSNNPVKFTIKIRNS